MSDTIEKAKNQSPGRFIVLVLLLAFVGAMIVLPKYVKGRVQSGNVCVNNLRQIAAAKNSWALENKKPAGTAVSSSDETGINKYLRHGLKPLCPAAGTIQYNSVGQAPTCTIEGHSI